MCTPFSVMQPHLNARIVACEVRSACSVVMEDGEGTINGQQSELGSLCIDMLMPLDQYTIWIEGCTLSTRKSIKF
jgi:hypothetical protein